MSDDYQTKTTWDNSTQGRVCTATAFSKKDGHPLLKCNVTLLYDNNGEFYRPHRDTSDVEIEKGVKDNLKMMMDILGLYQ